MKNNKQIYYGILFFYLYIKIYDIISDILISPLFIMKSNIYLVILLLLLIVVSFSIWFYRVKSFPKIKIWFILLVIALSLVINLLDIPGRFYMTGGNSFYSPKQQYLIKNYITTCESINTIVFIVIAFIKMKVKGKDR